MNYTFTQLSKKAQANCLRLQKKYNFKKLTDQQIIEKIADWTFTRSGEMFNGLTN